MNTTERKRLEPIYLMNVMLYIGISDIPQFIQVNKKAKEACEGIHINPWDDKLTFSKNIDIITKTFPIIEKYAPFIRLYISHIGAAAKDSRRMFFSLVSHRAVTSKTIPKIAKMLYAFL